MKLAVPLLTMVFAAGTPATLEEEPGSVWAPVEPVVDSFLSEDLEDINASIEEAADIGEEWVSDPVRIALGIVEPVPDAVMERRYLDVTYQADRSGRTGVVTIVTDGYRDDSMRGEWCRFGMHRLEDGTWRVREFRHAWRCYRGIAGEKPSSDPATLEHFTSEPCV